MNEEKRYAVAHYKGGAARRSGNPYTGHTKLVRDQHEQHDLGWIAQDAGVSI